METVAQHPDVRAGKEPPSLPRPSPRRSPEVGALRREIHVLLRCIQPGDPAELAPAIDDAIADPAVDWEDVLGLARTHGVIPLLYRALRGPREAHVPADILQRIRKDFHAMSLIIHLQLAALGRLQTALRARGIEMLVLKGLPLGQMAYGRPIWRKPGDIDILIRPRDYPGAREALIEMGLAPDLDGAAAANELSWKNQMTFRGTPSDVDVHLALEQTSHLGVPYSSGFDEDRIWRDRRQVAVGDATVSVLSPEDLFCFLCIHSAKHCWSLLFMIVDLAAFMTHATIDWDVAMARARALQAERYVHLSVLLAHRLLGTTVPAAMADALHANRALDALCARIVARLFGDARTQRPLSFHVLQARILPTLGERAAYAVNVCIDHVRRKRASRHAGA